MATRFGSCTCTAALAAIIWANKNTKSRFHFLKNSVAFRPLAHRTYSMLPVHLCHITMRVYVAHAFFLLLKLDA